MHSQFQADSTRHLRVFLCHSSGDKQVVVRELYQRLKAYNVDPWLDEENLLPGQAWQQEIRKAVRDSDVVVVCLSRESINKASYVQKEIKFVLDVADEKPEGTIFLIPLKLEACELPERLRHLQAVNLFEEEGFEKLINALKRRSESLRVEVAPLSLDVTHNAFLHTIPRTIEFSIQKGDIRSFDADVLALKYAQWFYGTDGLIAALLSKVGIEEELVSPAVGQYRYVDTHNCIVAHHALFVGIPSLESFDYKEIQIFSARVLEILSKEAPNTKHLVMTMHGVGFGLDEIEAFLAQFAGYLEAIQREHVPPRLEYITVIDKNEDRVQRLRKTLEDFLSTPNFAYQVKTRWAYRLYTQHLKDIFKGNQGSTRMIERVGIESDAKPLAFVAMPFKKEMDDVFYYGIQQPVRAAGFLCERIDQEAFIGDILDQVKKKIEAAVVVIAELSGANPNVYLEVGYAWGKGRPTILLMRDEQELRFDVRGQRCLKYERIRDLEESLKKELNELKSNGFI